MSKDSPFSLVSTNPKSLSNSQLESVVNVLKTSKDSDETILALQFLQRFCTTVKKQGILYEKEILKFISQNIENHPDKGVRIHSCALLLTLSFTNGEYKQELVRETALSLLLKLLKDYPDQQSFEIVEAVGVQLHSASFNQLGIEALVTTVEKMIKILTKGKIDEQMTGQVVDFITDFLDSEMFARVSISTPAKYPDSFLAVLSLLVSVIENLVPTVHGRLQRNCEGLLVVIKKKFGAVGRKNLIQKDQLVWSKVNKASAITVFGEGKVVTCPSGDHMVLFGDFFFTKGVVTIIVAIDKLSHGSIDYSVGVIKSLPNSYDGGFILNNKSVLGWGLSITTCTSQNYQEIFSGNSKAAPSSTIPKEGDVVTMVVDVNKGNLTYSVNGSECAELIGEGQIRSGVYVAASMYNLGQYTLQSAEYVEE